MPQAVGDAQMLHRMGVERRAELQRDHWWHRARRKVLEAALARLAVPDQAEVLDVGCGCGAMYELLSRCGPVSGVDVDAGAVEWARERGLGDVSRGRAESLPYEDGRFGLVTCLDVLEHVRDDAAALTEAARVTRSGGVLLITVPAYPSLFSAHDRAAGHFRRYRLGTLLSLAQRARLQPLLSTHFNALLLPAAAARRIMTRSKPAPRSDLTATPGILNAPLCALMRSEALLVRAGIRLPAGLSILVALGKGPIAPRG